MDENATLDKDFNKYLYILQPYLRRLADENVVQVCNEWLKKLSQCADEQKPLRNKYALSMCYQVARGVLFDPFTELPTDDELQPIAENVSSEDFNTELDEKEMANDSKGSLDEFNTDFEEANKCDSNSTVKQEIHAHDNNTSNTSNNENEQPHEIVHRNMINLIKNPNSESLKPAAHTKIDYERATKLIMQLRKLKEENTTLQQELSFIKNNYLNQAIDKSSSSMCSNDQIRQRNNMSSSESVRSKLGDTKISRNQLLYKIEKLQDELEFFEERKQNEFEKLVDKYEHDILELKTLAQEQETEFHKKIDETSKLSESKIKEIEDSASKKVQELQVKNEFLVKEKEIIVEAKDKEIKNLEKLLKEAKESFQTLTNKFAEKSAEGTSDSDFFKARAIELEKKVNKLEKYNSKCSKTFNTKLAMIQRDKHLTECSLQLQLVRQRSKIITKNTDETQNELKTALNNLESKYKNIVANIQSTAIQRKIQDQFYLESILQTYGMTSDSGAKANGSGCNRGQTAKTQRNCSSLEAEISALLAESKIQEEKDVLASARVDDSTEQGYCLDARKMGELFERIYVPQKDFGDGLHQK